MIKYLLGLLLLQFITVVLTVLYSDNLTGVGLLKLGIPLVIIALLAAFWFQSLSENRVNDQLARLKEQFAREREKIRVNAERAKTRVVKDAQKQIASEARRTHAKANFKVGAAFAGVVGAGGLMLLTELLTLGIMTLTTAGGALGGYLYRAKKEWVRPRELSAQEPHSVKVIEGSPAKQGKKNST